MNVSFDIVGNMSANGFEACANVARVKARGVAMISSCELYFGICRDILKMRLIEIIEERAKKWLYFIWRFFEGKTGYILVKYSYIS